MTPSPSDIAARRSAFRQLHASGCFVIPNPWDIGSARYLQGLGFKALATTSSGAAWSLGRSDGGLDRQDVLAHLRDMVVARLRAARVAIDESGTDTRPALLASAFRRETYRFDQRRP
jgi:2-methylisocitrate lyase-like PEP mutase family enzyme